MTQELMTKPPPGYRFATLEEKQEIMEAGMALHIYSSQVGQFNAQIEAAQEKLRRALTELQLAQAQDAALLKKLGLDGKPGNLHGVGKQILILVDPKKRVERLADLLKPAQIPAKGHKPNLPNELKPGDIMIKKTGPGPEKR